MEPKVKIEEAVKILDTQMREYSKQMRVTGQINIEALGGEEPAQFILRAAVLGGSIECKMTDNRHLHFIVAGNKHRSFDVGDSSVIFRSILGKLSFVIYDKLTADIPPMEVTAEDRKIAEKLVSEMEISDPIMRDKARLVSEVTSASNRRNMAVREAGIESLNPYGFQTTFRYPISEKETVPLYVETVNRGIEELYLYIKVVEGVQEDN